MFDTLKIIKNDIKNYFYISRQIKEMKKTKEWNELKLNNFFNSIYTYREIRQEIIGELDAIVRITKTREYFEPVFEWLIKWNLQDVIVPEPLEFINNSNIVRLILRPKPVLLTLNYIFACITIFFSIGLFILLFLKYV